MANVAKVRNLLQTINQIALYLTDEEISDIGKVMIKAIERMEKESEKVTGIDPRD